MAKKQCEKTTCSPLKRPGNQKTANTFNLTLDSSDDEAPDEVTFQESRSQALGSLRQALDTAKREKELLKEKRRKRHELFQEQKRKKLLPAAVLQEIDGQPSQEQKPAEGEEMQRNKNKMEKLRKVKKSRKNKKITHVRHLRGNNRVLTLKAGLRESLQQQAAEDFIRSRLYGPGSCRTTNNELLSLQNKTGKNKSAAVQFVKKDWALEIKAQAEKLNRRWIHTQQSPAS
ncbi:nucleolar protein 7 isoform X2 [Thalassophryne amazonica]|uniref:nucleolar protein 7 isoform X2 n=1 Tax=Thalassophryne amazonica TaxID=390379 RepID=UPI001471DE27|nr:nucleolar protein 7 isoform X2 [Thalassophryne amazonica]